MPVITIMFIGLFVVGVLVQVLTYRKEKAVKPRRIVISQAAAFLSMAVFSLITLRPPGPLWWVVLLSVGFGGGIVYGSFVKVRQGAKGVTMSYTLPWLLTWGALMTITQLSSVVFRTVPVIIYGLAIFNMGVNIGMNARVLLDYRTVAAIATAGLAVALLVGVTPSAEAQQDYDTALPEVMQGDVDGLSVDVTGSGGITGDCITTAFTNELGETVTVLVPIGTRLLPETPKTQIMVTAGNEVLEVGPGESEFYVKGFCSLHSAGAPGNGERFSFFEMADEDMMRVLRNIYEAGAFDYTGQEALWYVTDGGDLETMDPAARELIPDGIDGPTNDSDDYGAVGSEYDPGALLDASGQQPLGPLQTGAAIGLSSLILAAGSLLQLTDKLDPAAIMEALKGLAGEIPGSAPGAPTASVAAPLPDELTGLPQSADGRVYMRVPWDEAGEAWVTADEARQTLKMQREGYIWDNRWGWVTGGERSQYNATLEANRQQNLQQDPELARICRQIQRARAEGEAKAAYWKQQQIDAQRKWVLQNEIRSNELTSEALAYDVTVANLAYYPVAGIQLAADMAVGGIATVLTPTPLGPLAHSLRAGYNMAKGVAAAVGENIVGIPVIDPETGLQAIDPETGEALVRHAFTAEDLKRGTKYGVVNTALDFTIDAGARKLLGQPQLWKELAPAPPVPSSLLAPKAAVQQLTAGVDEVVASKGVAAAAETVDKAAILKLYEKGGMAKLAELEQLGQISKAQAAVMNRVVAEHVDGAVTTAAQKAVVQWDTAAQRVTLERVIIGDSGSSAGRAMKTASMLTDNDKAVVAIFNPDELAAEASRRGVTPAELYARLNKQVTEDVAGNVKLPGGLAPKDAKVELYSGMGGKAGPKDAYPREFTELRMATQGKGTVVDGETLSTYRTSGESVVDQTRLMQAAVGEPPRFTNPSFPVSEFPAVAEQQVQALAKPALDPKSAAKAMDRLLLMTERTAVAETGVVANPHLAQMARTIASNPQMDKGTIAYLAKNRYTPDEFAAAMQAEGARLAEHIQRVAPTLANK